MCTLLNRCSSPIAWLENSLAKYPSEKKLYECVDENQFRSGQVTAC